MTSGGFGGVGEEAEVAGEGVEEAGEVIEGEGVEEAGEEIDGVGEGVVEVGEVIEGEGVEETGEEIVGEGVEEAGWGIEGAPSWKPGGRDDWSLNWFNSIIEICKKKYSLQYQFTKIPIQTIIQKEIFGQNSINKIIQLHYWLLLGVLGFILGYIRPSLGIISKNLSKIQLMFIFFQLDSIQQNIPLKVSGQN